MVILLSLLDPRSSEFTTQKGVSLANGHASDILPGVGKAILRQTSGGFAMGGPNQLVAHSPVALAFRRHFVGKHD